MDRLVYLDH